MRFSRALNLTSVKRRDEFHERFIRPSLALLPLLPPAGRLLDVGSGMGIPGVPILLARPSLHGILVERRQKRAEFLRHLKRVLEFDAEIHAKDLEQLPCLHADVCVARAVDKVQHLLKMCASHALAGTLAVLTVPRSGGVVHMENWHFQRSIRIAAGKEDQVIHIYRYGKKVSRET
jgi:16S rRNA (guanine(527)-N(7))-methyltransferase RsmG